MAPVLGRLAPVGEVWQYQTYTIRDAGDRTVVAACKDVGCPAWAHGWESAFNESDACGSTATVQVMQQCARVRLGQGVCPGCGARYVRLESGRDFTEQHTEQGVTVFRFAAFQRCFRNHHTSPRLYVRRHGDWRGNPSGARYRHTRPQDWVEDFAENQQRLLAEIRKG